MKKITILSLHLGYGGIEKFITNLANSLTNNYKVKIVCTYKLENSPFFKLNNDVEIEYLTNVVPNKDKLIYNIKKLKILSLFKEIFKSIKILYLKKTTMINYIKKCDSDVIISTRDIHNKLVGKYANKNIIKIGSEHNYHNNNNKYIKKIIKSTKGLDYFVTVSNELNEFYKNKVYCKVVFIPNSIDQMPKSRSDLINNNIISVGRLEKIKGFNDLIDVFQIVLMSHPEYILNIVGSGSERKHLQKLITLKKLDNNIKLLGYKNSSELNKLYKDSSLYLMSSYSESFGIVLIEAMSFGIPCIAFDSANGAKEIISNNWDGYLIKNRDKKLMAKRIINLMEDSNRRFIMGNNCYKKAQSYLSSNVCKKWIDIIEK